MALAGQTRRMVDTRAGRSDGSRVRAAARRARHRQRRAAPHHRCGPLSAAPAHPGAWHPVVGDDSGGPPVVAVYFLESSAVVKRYAQETGSAWIALLNDPQAGHHLSLARITAVEVVAAVARRQRGGAFAATEAAAALADFADDLAHHYRQVDNTVRLSTQAIALAQTSALRGYDAIQLAAVLTVHVAREAQGLPRLTLVSADHERNAAAVAEGVLVDDPNRH